MIDYTYTYLLLGLLFLFVWLVIFLTRRDLRPEMLLIGIIFGIAGSVTDILYYQDWWSPTTITGTVISVEVVIAAFSICSVSSVLPSLFTRVRPVRPKNFFDQQRIWKLALILAAMNGLFFGSFFLLGFNSLLATIITLAAPLLVIWRQRPDLVKRSLLGGVLLSLVAIAIYSVLELATPGWVNEFYHFKNTPHILLLNLPLDDLVFYVLAGMFFSVFYWW